VNQEKTKNVNKKVLTKLRQHDNI